VAQTKARETQARQTPARWLDAGEQEAWRSFVIATRLLFEQFERDLQREAGIPLAYYEILMVLSETPGRTLRMSEIADLLRASRSRLSHAVARLEEAGWVRRDRCPSDLRGSFATLTDEGFAALKAAAPGHVESVRRHLFDQLTPEELEQLGAISKRLLEHLIPVSGWPAPDGECCPTND
jgi:DNA-binding MarR family transcriptional regulator